MAKSKKITETGPKSLRGIRNPDLYNKSGENPLKNILTDLQRLDIADRSARALYRNYEVAHGHIGYEGLRDPNLYQVKQLAPGKTGILSYGNSTYDSGIIFNATDDDVQNQRAEKQPWYVQIGNGVAKGAVIAGTTFLDGVAGTIAGIGNVIYNANNINSVGDAFNKFIDNPFSNLLLSINDKFEDWLPNYYSTEEQRRPWYENIFTANFIGDKFLKNLGFTIGAAYSAKTVAAGAAKMMKLDKLRLAFKGAVTTATGEVLKDSNAIAKAYLTGDAVMDGTKITEDLIKSAKKLRRADIALKSVGAITAAAGEGRIEAIQGAKEWTKLHKLLLYDNKQKEYQDALQKLLLEKPGLFSLDPYGNPVLTYEGEAELANRKKAIDDKYNEAIAKVNSDGAKMANIIFSLNVPLLSIGNIWQFGKFISGGYNSGRTATNLLKGSLKSTTAEAKLALTTMTKDEAKEALKNLLRTNKGYINTQLAKSLASPLWEGQEEMSQLMILEIPGAKYASELNNFYGKKIDPDAEKETIDWLKAIAIGFSKSYGSVQLWELGFIGALTGILGAPKLHLRNAEGKFRPSITNEGNLYAGFREYSENKKLANDIFNKLNSKDFINLYRGKIRHTAILNDLDFYLKKGDAFNFKNSEASQLVSDIIMMDNAGLLNEFLEEIDAAGEITQELVLGIREAAANQNGASFMDKMSDDQVIAHVKKLAKDMRRVAENYSKISNSLKTLYGTNIDDEVLEELTWQMTQIDEFESRGLDLIKEIREPIELKAKLLKDRFEIDIDVVLNNYKNFEEAFGGDKNLLEEILHILEDDSSPVVQQRKAIWDKIQQYSEERSRIGLKLGARLQLLRKGIRTKFETLNNDFLSEIESSLQNLEKIDNLNSTEDIKNAFEIAKQKIVEKYGSFDKMLLTISTYEPELKLPKQKVTRDPIQPIEKDKRVPVYKTNLDNLDGRSQRARSLEAFTRVLYAQRSNDLASWLVALKQLLEEVDLILNPLITNKLIDDFTDLMKIVSLRSAFINNYNALSKNPEAFTAKSIEQTKKIINGYLDKLADELINELDSIKTLLELKEILDNIDDDIIDRVVERIKKSKNSKLKKLFKEYKKLRDAKSIFDLMKQEGIYVPIVIYDILENVKSYNEFTLDINDLIKDELLPKEERNAVKNAMKLYLELLKSKLATEKDNNKPKKKLKDSKKEDDEEDDEEEDIEDDEVVEEESAESPSSKSKKFNKKVNIAVEDEDEDDVLGDLDDLPNDDPDVENAEEGLEDDKFYFKSKLKLHEWLRTNGLDKHAEYVEEKLDENDAVLYADVLSYLVNDQGVNISDIEEINPYDMFIIGKDSENTDTETIQSLNNIINKQTNPQVKLALSDYVHNNSLSNEESYSSSEPFLESVSLDNLDRYIESLNDLQLQQLVNTNWVSTLLLEKTMGIELDQNVPRNKDTIKIIRKAALEKIAKRLELKKQANKNTATPKARLAASVSKTQKSKKVKFIYKNDDELDLSIIDIVQDLTDDQLKDFAEGRMVDESMSAKERKNFAKLAAAEYQARTAPSSSDESNELNNSPENNRYTEDSSLRSWRVAQYEFDPLSDKKERKAVVWDNHLVSKLRDLGAYQFVDNGSLGTLFNNNPNIPIRLILSLNVTSKRVPIPLLGIEITDDIKKLVNPINPITIEDSLGKKHLYQIVGSLYHNKSLQSKTNYDEVTQRLYDELLDKNLKLGKPYAVSEKMHTLIRHLYSGRFVKSDENNPVAYRSLKEVLKGDKPYFYIYYNQTQLKTTVPSDERIVPLNSNNANPREGSVWLATKEADGRYYLKSLKVARFNEYDLDAHRDNSLILRIIKDLEDIVNSNLSDSERGLAKYDLESILHFKKSNRILFNGDSVSILNFEDNIAEGMSLEDKVLTLLEALQSDQLSLRFSVNPRELYDEDYVETLLDADILTTDMLYTHNVNGSFDTYLIDDDGNPIIDTTLSTGHTGPLGVQAGLSYKTIFHNGDEYRIKDDGTIVDDLDLEVTNLDLITEINFIAQVRDKKVLPIEGDDDLYISTYDGVEEFGVKNNLVYTDEALQELKEKAAENIKKIKQRQALAETSKLDDEDDDNNDDDDDNNDDNNNSGGSSSSSTTYNGHEVKELGLAAFGGMTIISDDEANALSSDDSWDSEDDDLEDDDLDELPSTPESTPDSPGPAPSSGGGFSLFNNSLGFGFKLVIKKLNSAETIFTMLASKQQNRIAIKNVGINSISELIDYIKANPSLGSIETINTLDAFDSMIEEIRRCLKP